MGRTVGADLDAGARQIPQRRPIEMRHVPPGKAQIPATRAADMIARYEEYRRQAALRELGPCLRTEARERIVEGEQHRRRRFTWRAHPGKQYLEPDARDARQLERIQVRGESGSRAPGSAELCGPDLVIGEHGGKTRRRQAAALAPQDARRGDAGDRGRRRHQPPDHAAPVWPKPPAPRPVASSPRWSKFGR